MKKVVLSICAVAFIALIAVNVNLGLAGIGTFSGFSLKNIMALAQGETGVPGCSVTANCYLGSVKPENIYATVSCNGKTKCVADLEKVTCDGVVSICAL